MDVSVWDSIDEGRALFRYFKDGSATELRREVVDYAKLFKAVYHNIESVETSRYLSYKAVSLIPLSFASNRLIQEIFNRIAIASKSGTFQDDLSVASYAKLFLACCRQKEKQAIIFFIEADLFVSFVKDETLKKERETILEELIMLSDLEILDLIKSRGISFDIPLLILQKTPLMLSIELESEELFSYFLSKDVSCLRKDLTGRTALHYATSLEKDEWIQKILGKDKSSLEVKDNEGKTALFYAVQSNCLPTFKTLTQLGADCNTVDCLQNTLLHESLRNGFDDISFYLMEACVDLNRMTDQEGSPLHLICSQGKDNLAEKALLKGALPTLQDKQGVTPLMKACERGSFGCVSSLLKYTKAPPLEQDVLGNQAIHYAAEEGSLKIVSLLAAKGADLAAKNSEGKNPLLIACAENNRVVARFLIESGKVEVFAQDNEGNTALHAIAVYNDCELFELVKESYPLPLPKNKRGKTALHVACSEGSFELFAKLVERGESIHVKDGKGKTCCHLAAEKNNTRLLDSLLRKGISLKERCALGRTPFESALVKRQMEAATFLYLSDSSVSVENQGIHEFFVYHCQKEDAKIAKQLIFEGVNPFYRDSENRTGLQQAISLGHSSFVKEIMNDFPEVCSMIDAFGLENIASSIKRSFEYFTPKEGSSLLEIPYLLGDKELSSFLLAFYSRDDLAFELKIMERKYPINVLCYFFSLAYEIDTRHLQLGVSPLRILEAPAEVDLQAAFFMFSRLEFFDRKKPCFISLHPFFGELSESETNKRVSEIQEGLRKFVDNIKNRVAIIGAPPRDKEKEFRDFYDTLENGYRNIFSKLLNKDALEQAHVLIELSSVALKCGTRYYSEMIRLYARYMEEDFPIEQEAIDQKLYRFLCKLRKECIQGATSDSLQNTHEYLSLIKLLQKELGLDERDVFEDPYDYLSDVRTYDDALKRLLSLYTPCHLLREIYLELHLPKKNKGINQIDFVDLAKSYLYPRWNSNPYSESIELLRGLDPVKMQPRIEEIFRSLDVPYRLGHSHLELIEHAHYVFLEKEVYDENGQFKASSILQILESLSILRRKGINLGYVDMDLDHLPSLFQNS